MPNGGRVSLLVRWCTDATTPGSAVCVCVGGGGGRADKQRVMQSAKYS